MSAATLYTLIVVTYGGNVSVTPNIPSLPVCEDARQMADNGRTVAEQKAADAQQRKLAETKAESCKAASGIRPFACVIGFDSRVAGPGDVRFSRCVIDPSNRHE